MSIGNKEGRESKPDIGVHAYMTGVSLTEIDEGGTYQCIEGTFENDPIEMQKLDIDKEIEMKTAVFLYKLKNFVNQ